MMKRFIKVFLSAGIPFGIIMGIFFSILFQGVYRGILSGIMSALLFGLIISVFAEIQRKRFREISDEVTKGNNVIMDGGANHFKGVEGIGGWLYLTSKELIFKSHGFNIQTHETAIGLEQIEEVKAVNNLRVIPNGVKIVTKGGIIEKFVVNNRKAWIKEINCAISFLDN